MKTVSFNFLKEYNSKVKLNYTVNELDTFIISSYYTGTRTSTEHQAQMSLLAWIERLTYRL